MKLKRLSESICPLTKEEYLDRIHSAIAQAKQAIIAVADCRREYFVYHNRKYTWDSCRQKMYAESMCGRPVNITYSRFECERALTDEILASETNEEIIII